MSEENRPAATDWGLVLAVFGAGVAAAFQVGKTPPSLPMMMPDLGLSLFAAGWAISLLNLVGSLGGLLSGTMADLLGYRRVILTGMVILALGSLLGALAQGPAVLLVSRFIEGLGYILVSVTGPALIIGVTHPKNLRQALSIWIGYLAVGASLMMLLSPLALGSIGWRGLWLANSALLLAYCVFLARITSRLSDLPAPDRRRAKTPWADIRLTLSRPGPLLLAASFTLYALQFFAVVGFLPTLLIDDLKLEPSTAAVLTALVALFNAPGILLGGWLLQRGFRRVILICLAGLVMGLCGLGIYNGALGGGWRYSLCLLFSAVGGLVPASLVAGVPVHAPRPGLVATTNGLVMQGGSLGGLIGPPALALTVSVAGGWSGAPWLLTGSASAAILLALWLGRLEAGSETD